MNYYYRIAPCIISQLAPPFIVNSLLLCTCKYSWCNYREDDWEIDRMELEFSQKIGEGYFSEIWKAVTENLKETRGRQTVAVKMLKGNNSDTFLC